MASEKHTESVSRLNARIEELEAEIDLLQREVTATYQAYDDMMRCKDEEIAELRKQIGTAVLPEGVEWPRFEDGELVKFGDEVDGIEGKIGTITLYTHGFVLNGVYYHKGEPAMRPEPEVLDADGVPIKVGDAVWHEDYDECVVERIYSQDGDALLDLYVCRAIWNMAGVKPAEVTHRKPDTQEAIDADATVPAAVYCVRHGLVESDSDVDDATLLERHILDLLERQRKLLGGE